MSVEHILQNPVKKISEHTVEICDIFLAKQVNADHANGPPIPAFMEVKM